MGWKRGLERRRGGRGADVVIEVVGLSPALRTGFDLLRRFGILSSLGVHNGEVSELFSCVEMERKGEGKWEMGW
jgi:threonine dehydrogenase-like Zn-dependent dehydrogenase